MLNTSFSPWPCYTDDEVEAVASVLRSNQVNYWTGDEGRRFEREFAEWVGTTQAIALANGTVALDLALRALDIGVGDEVVVAPRTFIASASCVANAGAVPVFADVDRDSGNISASTIQAMITDRTKAIIVVHLGGRPADMDPIMALAREHGLFVVEDCAQAHGARYKGQSVGSIGDIGTWSFCQDKIMTTGGEGGMVTVSDEDLWSKMWSYKDHGKSWDAVYNRQHSPGFRWLHDSFGTNWRMTEMQAVLGRVQLPKMATWTARRSAHAERIRQALEPLASADGPVRLPSEPNLHAAGNAASVHAYYRFYCYVRPDKLARGWDRDRIVEAIREAGVPCFQGSCSEIYLERAFAHAGLAPAQRLVGAMDLGETSMAFLVHPTLTESEIERTVAVSEEVLRSACP